MLVLAYFFVKSGRVNELESCKFFFVKIEKRNEILYNPKKKPLGLQLAEKSLAYKLALAITLMT